MRTFDRFPNDSECPICGSNADRPCVLIPVTGTDRGGCCEAKPVHADCIKSLELKLTNDLGAIYQLLK